MLTLCQHIEIRGYQKCPASARSRPQSHGTGLKYARCPAVHTGAHSAR